MIGSDSTASGRHGSGDIRRETPHGEPPSPQGLGPASVEELQTAECWRLLETTALGRLAVDGLDGRPDVFPVNYLVHNGSLFIRSAPGAKVGSIVKRPAVAFEIDDESGEWRWSIVIRGSAERLTSDSDIDASGIRGLVPSHPTTKFIYIRLTPDTVTGRRFAKRPPPTARRNVPDVPYAPDQRGSTGEADRRAPRGREAKPDSIPHYAPLPDE